MERKIYCRITTAEAPNAFWDRKQHSVDLPYTEEKVFDRKGIFSIKPAQEIHRHLNAETPSHSSLLKNLFQTMDKESISTMWKEVFGKEMMVDSPSSSNSFSTKEDELMKDAQEPSIKKGI